VVKLKFGHRYIQRRESDPGHTQRITSSTDRARFSLRLAPTKARHVHISFIDLWTHVILSTVHAHKIDTWSQIKACEAKLKVKGTVLLAVLMYAFYVFLVTRDKYRKGK